MRTLLFTLFMQALPLAFAQYDYGPETTTTTESTTSASSTSTATAAVHTVDVGEDGFTFSPDSLTVAPGGKVEFHFYPGNHSVAEAAFSHPCHPLSDSSFFTGFMPDATQNSQPIFTLTVNTTDPIWYYCGQIGHCQGGMVGVINPPKNGPDTLESFKAAAANAGATTVPADVGGGISGTPNSETGSTTGGTTGTTTMATSPTGTTGATTTPTGTGSAGVFSPASFLDMCVLLLLSVSAAVYL